MEERECRPFKRRATIERWYHSVIVSDHGRVDEDERCIVKSLP